MKTPKTPQLERAETLEAMIKSFRPGALKEADLSEFYYDNTMPVRMGDPSDLPLDDLFEDCITPLDANAHLLSGQSGCGKSTELHNLSKRFKDAGYSTYIINSQQEMNLNIADNWDIMLFIAYGLCNIAEQNNIKLPEDVLKEMFDYITKEMKEIDIIYDKASFGLGVILDLFAFIKSNLQFGAETRTIIQEKMERRASEWMRYVDEISGIITDEKGGKQPILIVEDLDKIQPYERAFDIFRYDTLAKMPFPIIYTFPIAAAYDSRFASVRSLYSSRIFPMIKVSNIDKSENSDGIEVIRKIVELRADLALFEAGVLEVLIKKTGGVLRHLFECILTASRRARRRGADRIELEDAQRALSDLAATLVIRISMDDYPMLTKIITNLKYKQHIEDKDSLLRLMHGQIILEYRNGDLWRDAHPLIEGFLKEQGVINE